MEAKFVSNQRSYDNFSRLKYYEAIYDPTISTIRLGNASSYIRYQILNLNYSKYRIESKFEYRPDLISHNFYNTPNLWWVIYEFNTDITHPLKDFYIDRLISIPNYNEVISLLL